MWEGNFRYLNKLNVLGCFYCFKVFNLIETTAVQQKSWLTESSLFFRSIDIDTYALSLSNALSAPFDEIMTHKWLKRKHKKDSECVWRMWSRSSLLHLTGSTACVYLAVCAEAAT